MNYKILIHGNFFLFHVSNFHHHYNYHALILLVLWFWFSHISSAGCMFDVILSAYNRVL